MVAARSIKQLAGRKLVLELPLSFENKRVEIIVLTLDADESARRRPNPSIAGKMTSDGELFDSVPESDWEFGG